MTDTEKLRLMEVSKLFKIASTKVQQGSLEFFFYGAIAMTLGWVLDEPVYRENFESHIARLKSMGVEPAVITDPNNN